MITHRIRIWYKIVQSMQDHTPDIFVQLAYDAFMLLQPETALIYDYVIIFTKQFHNESQNYLACQGGLR